jgi:hypothetical protein
MNRKWISTLGFAAASLAFLLVGCEGTFTPGAAADDVSGSWVYTDSGNQQSTWALVQSDGGAITGAATDGASITGDLNSDTIDLSLTYSDSSTYTLNGTVTTNVMSGTFTNSLAVSGTWSAVKTN